MKLHKFSYATFCIVFISIVSLLFQSVALAYPLAAETTTLTTHISGQGTLDITPDLAIYTPDQSVTLSATPEQGWSFDQWSGDLNPRIPWADATRRFRMAITVNANGYERSDKPIELSLNFTDLLSQAGQSGTFADNSLRVVEISSDGTVLNNNVPWQFDRASGYNSATNASGQLTFLALGTTASSAVRQYHLYFELSSGSYTPVTVTPLITFTDNVTDERKSSFQIETPSGDYYFQKAGGAFSSLDDVDGNDWISYSRLTGSAGAYRGIPNMIHPEGRFHPGSSGTNSVLQYSGPLKVTFSASFSYSGGTWEALWEIFPHYARMTVLSAGHDYWFLYEGVPGGKLDSADEIVFSDGTVVPWNGRYDKDIPNEEWAYASDPNVGTAGRSLFMIHHEDDTGRDSYADQNDTMTILAFGRNAQDGTKYLDADAMPQHFTIGLMDETSYNSASKVVRGAYKDLTVATAAIEQLSDVTAIDPNDPVLTLPMSSSRVITATFSQDFYTIDLTVVDDAGNPIDPTLVQLDGPMDAQGYVYGETVGASADESQGWRFQGWSGALNSTNPAETFNVVGNAAITATFELNYYTVSAIAVDEQGAPVSGQSIQLSAPAEQAGYRFGEEVTATIDLIPGWTFQGWSGSAVGSAQTISLLVDADETLTATLTPNYYTVTSVINDENGNAAPGSTIALSAPSAPAGYRYGEVVTATVQLAPGWRFVNWSGAASGSNGVTTITIDADETITATVAPIYYTVAATAVDMNGAPATGNTVQLSAPANAQGYLYGEEVSAVAVAAAGWRFVEWQGSASGQATSTTITVDENETVTARFAPDVYTVVVKIANDNGQSVNAATVKLSTPIDPAGYRLGDLVKVTLTPLTGWTFSHWEGPISSDKNPLTFTITGDTALTAVFTTDQALLTTSAVPAEGGTVTPAEQQLYNVDEIVPVMATANDGWRFVGWSGDLSGTATETTITMNGDKTVVANFAPIYYTIDVVPGGVSGATGGFVELSTPLQGEGFRYNETVTLTATANSGYRFVIWSVSDGKEFPVGVDAKSPTITFLVSADLDFVANFEPNDVQRLYLPMISR